MHVAPAVRRLLSQQRLIEPPIWASLAKSRSASCRRPFTSRATASSHAEVANVSQADVDGARQYCINMLRNYDAPSYTLLAFIPPPAQAAYLSLRALNVSLAMVGDSTSASTVGAMRMQFWRDTITRALALAPPKEPIAILLAHAAATLASRTDGTSRFSKPWLLRIVGEREKFLHNPPYPDLAALETYAENTYSTLLYLTLSALPVASVTADHVASHIGKAQGITAILRGLPLLAFPGPPKDHSNRGAAGGAPFPTAPQQGTVTLPLDIMVESGVREEDVLRKGADAHGLRDAVFKVATRANDHLITAREMLKNLRAGQDVGHEFEHAADPEHQHEAQDAFDGQQQQQQQQGHASLQLRDVERGFGVFMPAVATQMWLDQLQKQDFDVFAPALRKTDWKLPFKAYWAFSKRKF